MVTVDRLRGIPTARSKKREAISTAGRREPGTDITHRERDTTRNSTARAGLFAAWHWMRTEHDMCTISSAFFLFQRWACPPMKNTCRKTSGDRKARDAIRVL